REHHLWNRCVNQRLAKWFLRGSTTEPRRHRSVFAHVPGRWRWRERCDNDRINRHLGVLGDKLAALPRDWWRGTTHDGARAASPGRVRVALPRACCTRNALALTAWLL